MSSAEDLMVAPRATVSFYARTPLMLDEDEVRASLRGALLALAARHANSASSVRELSQILSAEGVLLDNGKADPARLVTSPKEVAKRRKDDGKVEWSRSVEFLESLPEGSWTSFKEIGKASGQSPQNASNWLSSEWNERLKEGRAHMQNQHRILPADGEVRGSFMPDAAIREETIEILGLREEPAEDGDGFTWNGALTFLCKLPGEWEEFSKTIEKKRQDLSHEQVRQLMAGAAITDHGENQVVKMLEDRIDEIKGAVDGREIEADNLTVSFEKA